MKNLETILEKSTQIFNNKSLTERKEIIPNELHTQIKTLQIMKVKIRANAKKQCTDIDGWIDNLGNELRKYIEHKEGGI